MLVLSYFHRTFSLLRIYAFIQIASQTAAEEPVLIIRFHHHKEILFLHVTDNYRGINTLRYDHRQKILSDSCIDVCVK